MAQQARNYLTGAVSGTALIGLAVVAFVMLVSLQTLRDWPLAGLGLGGGADSNVGSTTAPSGPPVFSAASVGRGTPPTSAAGVGTRSGGTFAGNGNDSASPGVASPLASSPSAPAAESPAGSPADAGGSSPSSPTSSAASSGSSSSRSSGGGAAKSPGSGSGEGGGSGGSSVSGAATNAVNETVSGVDNVTGGALGATGVPKVTEEVVNGVAGPESPVGEVVDRTVEKVQETVGGLLGGGR